MPCQTYKIGDSFAIVRFSGRGAPKPCIYCGGISSFLCDFPVSIGRMPKGRKKRKDCDRPLCRRCTLKGVSENVDFCREHFPLAFAAWIRKLLKSGLLLTPGKFRRDLRLRERNVLDGRLDAVKDNPEPLVEHPPRMEGLNKPIEPLQAEEREA